MVDIFGRMLYNGISSPTKVVSAGSRISTAELKNTFLRRDGQNTASADISFNSRKITSLVLFAASLIDVGTSDNDAANKTYVDNRAKLP